MLSHCGGEQFGQKNWLWYNKIQKSIKLPCGFTSSCSFLNSPFFQPSSRFSMGDVKGRRVLVLCKKSFSTPSTVVPFIAELLIRCFTFTNSSLKPKTSKQRGGSRSPPSSSSSKNWRENTGAPKTGGKLWRSAALLLQTATR